jgi:chromosome segregation ATPase
MADDGSAPRGNPPPRPSSRSPSPSPPQDLSPPKTQQQQQQQQQAAGGGKKVTGWDEIANRVMTGSLPTSNYVGSFTTRDTELDQLRRMLNEYRDENEALGEAVTSIKGALDASTAAAATAEAASAAASAACEAAKGAHAESRGLLAAAEVEMKDLKSSLDDVEQLAVDLQDDLKAAKAAAEVAEEARTAAEGRAADDAGAAESAAEETHAAQAMAKELRDRVAHLERDAEVGRDVQLCTAVECSCPPMA